MALIGASLLALALTATSPALAADSKKAASESTTKAKAPAKTKTSDAKTEKAASKTSTAKSGKTEVASAKDGDGKKKSSDGDKKTTKTAEAGTSKSKTGSKDKTGSKLADADERPAKGSSKTTKDSKTKASAAKSKLASADDAEEDDAKPAKSGSKASKTETSKSSKSRNGKTKLADADDSKGKKGSGKGGKDIDKKAKADGKTSKLADGSVKKSKKGKKAAPEPKPVPDKAMLTLAAALANDARAEVPVNLSSGPMPYMRATPTVLSAGDAELYRTAYSQIDAGKYDDAEATLAQVSDKSLVGHVEYRKLFSGGYTATYDELVAWVNQYGDQPMAMKVWNLAKRKKPDGAPDPAFPSLMGKPGLAAAALDNDGAGVQLASTGSLAPTIRADLNPGAPMSDAVDSDLTVKSARSAYNNGQLEQAVTLGKTIGDHWVAGLASYRLKRYDQALVHFKFVSTDPSRNAWSQSSGAYWAARSALKMNDAATADAYFKIAASYPFTFYGLLAEARLGVTPAIALAKKGLPPTFQPDSNKALVASLNSNSSDWAKTNPQAQRMSALVQLGRMNDARDEVRSAMQTASDDAMRQKWMALAVSHNIPVGQMKTTDRLFNADLYPIPDYALSNAKVDRALVYAFARKESKFNAAAKSYAGAYGLMQIMPGTAALVEGDSSFTRKPNQLLKAETNLRIGQKYIQRLMDTKATEGDLLRTIAAYNAGPGPVKDAMDSLGNDYDSLLVMESIPVAQTRQYIEEVAANYWIYRQIMGKETPSLHQAANDARIIDASADALDAEAEVALVGTE
ncbi:MULTISPECIES: lytic transglycosylase domain-containing protein [Asticcacaulis]|uniref:lytic transglycosylase domain-containing protein n=1 Tax=Asticcacaulis TaxID=76890 RepID=UPI001FD91EC5|nr:MULTISPECIES: lytic transglycosylase domain-containing protein [Asticcacaulis]MBP2158492.1 soluble lytic murein transglycosylase-like protein [Asticcacaulis solisilvae]MDR6799538.1 soluble lytic murein transglycosylase-like protein [Asticcacaulis sp. BE141]